MRFFERLLTPGLTALEPYMALMSHEEILCWTRRGFLRIFKKLVLVESWIDFRTLKSSFLKKQSGQKIPWIKQVIWVNRRCALLAEAEPSKREPTRSLESFHTLWSRRRIPRSTCTEWLPPPTRTSNHWRMRSGSWFWTTRSRCASIHRARSWTLNTPAREPWRSKNPFSSTMSLELRTDQSNRATVTVTMDSERPHHLL